MLYLNPPYFVINGVSVFPDDTDLLQFYYLPMMPHLTMRTGTDGNPIPQIQLIEYGGAAGTGGFLNFDVNLGISPDVLDEVAQEVQRQLNLNGSIRLSPVTFVDGTVRLILLGAQSPMPTGGVPGGGSTGTAGAAAGTAVATAGQPQFVVKIQNAAKPALYGDNQATFSVELDQYGATILQKALGGEITPIAVIYSLDFLGLRPAFNVRITTDWSRVQKVLDTQYGGGFLFFSSQIEKTVDSLIESKVINIDESTYVTEGDLGASATSDRDRAVAECYELVKTNFFESSLQPPDPNKPDAWDSAARAYRTISDIAMGGPAAMACFSYKSVDLTRTDQKSLNFDVTERTTVQRTIYPQGHLSGVLDAVRRAGVELTQFILKVDLDNPYFQRRRVSVTTHADFDADSIGSIDVTMTYGGTTLSVTLTKAAPQASVDWSSVLVNGQMSMPVSYSYTVNFAGVDTTQRPGQLTSDTLSAVGNIDIEPRGQLYDITVIPVRALAVPWDRYSTVEIECQYVDEQNGINQQPSAILTSQNAEVDWSLFLRDTSRRSFRYRLTYTLIAGGKSTSAWITTSDATVNISDPFPMKAQLTVLAGLDWNVFTEALVFLAYPSKESATLQQTYTLTQSAATTPAFLAERQDTSRLFIYYEARLIKRNGQVWTIPGSVTSDPYLILQDGMKGHQVIVVQPEAIDFASKNVQQIAVQLRYTDSANSIDATQSFVLNSVGDSRTFAYDYLDPAISAEYRADIALNNGQTKSIEWTETNGNTVIVPLSQLD